MSPVTPSFRSDHSHELAHQIYSTRIKDLFFLKHNFNPDERGSYSELAKIPHLDEVTGQKFQLRQLNLSHSKTHVTRGLHAEGWNKLATVISGAAYCALADIRPDSSTFGRVESFYLGALPLSERGCLYIPQGVANSFCIVEGSADYLYAVDKLYQDRDPQQDQAISLFDPDLRITWPIPKSEMIISERDRQSITLRELFPDKFK